MAISEAVEVAASDPETKYSLGSVLNHVLLHQTIIGEETIKQFEKAGEYPDTINRLRRWRIELWRIFISICARDFGGEAARKKNASDCR